MEGTIFTLIVAIIMIVAHVLKAIKESAAVAKQQKQEPEEDDLVLIASPQPGKKLKQTKMNKQRLVEQRQISIFDPPKRQALSKKLAPQGEGERFEADPGTLDTTRIVMPTIDPTVKPELESITGIYEEGATFTDRTKSAINLKIADDLAKPEGIIQAVIFAEILNRRQF